MAVEKKLMSGGEFVRRYETEDPCDGLPPGEGAFLASRTAAPKLEGSSSGCSRDVTT